MNYQYSDLIDGYVEQEIEKIRLQIAIAEEKRAIAEKEAEASKNCILSLIRKGIVTVEQIAGIMSITVQEFNDKYGSL